MSLLELFIQCSKPLLSIRERKTFAHLIPCMNETVDVFFCQHLDLLCCTESPTYQQAKPRLAGMVFLKIQGKPELPVLADFSLHRRRAPAREIGPTSTQAASGGGKARSVANSGASGGGDWREEGEEFKVEGELH